MKLLFYIALTVSLMANEPQIPASQADAYNEVLKIMKTNPQEALKKIATLVDASPAFDYIKADILLSLGKAAEAQDALKQALQKMPDFTQAQQLLAVQYLKQKKYQEALPHLLKVAELGKADFLWWQNIAACYVELGRFKAAEEAYRQARVFSADDRQIDKALLSLYVRQQNFQLASQLAAQLVDSDLKDRESWRILISCLLHTKEEATAFANMIVFAKLFTLTDDEKNLLADMYFKNGLYTDANALYASVSGSFKGQAVLQRARCFMAVNDFENALKMLVIDSLSHAEKISAHSLRADCFKALKQPDKAMVELLEVLQYDSNHTSSQFKLAEMYESTNSDKAQYYYNLAAQNNLFKVAALQRSARLYMLEKQHTLAIRQARQAYEYENSEQSKKFLEQILNISLKK